MIHGYSIIFEVDTLIVKCTSYPYSVTAVDEFGQSPFALALRILAQRLLLSASGIYLIYLAI